LNPPAETVPLPTDDGGREISLPWAIRNRLRRNAEHGVSEHDSTATISPLLFRRERETKFDYAAIIERVYELNTHRLPQGIEELSIHSPIGALQSGEMAFAGCRRPGPESAEPKHDRVPSNALPSQKSQNLDTPTKAPRIALIQHAKDAWRYGRLNQVRDRDAKLSGSARTGDGTALFE